jgi:uncharacterized protein DUF4928
MANIQEQLQKFSKEYRIIGKGPLSVVLVITRLSKDASFPLTSKDFLTEKGGQVKGLGKSAVQTILKDYGISRTLSEEGGRTSRGSIDLMKNYLSFLNSLYQQKILNFEKIERWWIDRVKTFFAGKPFKFKIDPSRSIRSAVRDLIEQAFKRQKDVPGMMFAGAMFQHLVGAKLQLILPSGIVKHNGFSVADEPSKRIGDFVLDDVCIHVTTAPSESLIRKCKNNIERGKRPIIVTSNKGAAGIDVLSANEGIEGRIDIFEIEQFVASNIYEIGKFVQDGRRITVEQLFKCYNKIIEDCETDPSLKVEIG